MTYKSKYYYKKSAEKSRSGFVCSNGEDELV